MATLRARLRAGEMLVGPMLTLNCPEVAELCTELGYDWLFLDAEHTPVDVVELQRMLQAAKPTPCLLRLADDSPTTIAKALDIG